jgi:hypothetical protein
MNDAELNDGEKELDPNEHDLLASEESKDDDLSVSFGTDGDDLDEEEDPFSHGFHETDEFGNPEDTEEERDF